VLDAAVSLVGPMLDGIALRLCVPDQPVTPNLAQADLTLLPHQRIRIVALVQLG